MLSITNLACFKGDKLLFSHLNSHINAGELLHVIGANGSGKTTLLRTICGLIKPDEGTIAWNNTDTSRECEDYHSELLYIGHKNGLKGDLTPVENLLASCFLEGQHVTSTVIKEVLVQFGLGQQASLPTRLLSQGQQRRVALTRLALTNTALWVLDEPFTALDRQSISDYLDLITTHIRTRQGSVILTTHQKVDLEDCKQLDMSDFQKNTYV